MPRDLSPQSPSAPSFDVLIVGAGPAGLGCAAALKQCGIENLAVVDFRGVGAAFEAWPAQMRMVSPSFHSNPFGQADLNAITPHTSPADFIHSEHPTGSEYASYLQAIASFYQFEVKTGIEITGVEESGDCLALLGSPEPLLARHVVWTAGEFFFPRQSIKGSEHCLHNTKVADWSELPGIEHAIIGGFESGIDAAVHLARQGKSVHVLSRGEPWHQDSSDPSRALSPFTVDRLKDVLLNASGTVRFYKNADIVEVARSGDNYFIMDEEGEPFEISTPPILCTGFNGGLALSLLSSKTRRDVWRSLRKRTSLRSCQTCFTAGLCCSIGRRSSVSFTSFAPALELLLERSRSVSVMNGNSRFGNGGNEVS